MGRPKFNKKKIRKLVVKVIVPEDKTIKITWLNDKCLKKVCDYLEMDDLSNLAASCTRFTRVCDETFEKKFHHLYTNFQIRIFELNDKAKFTSYTNMLIHFGKHIKKLRVEYDANKHNDNKKMHDLIVENCSESVTELHILEMGRYMKFDKVFKQLSKLKLTRCHLNGSVILFEQWCPNICQFEIEMVQSVANTTCIEQKFPKLERFSLLNFVDCNFSVKNIRNFIKNNPQLKKLRICRDVFGFALNITPEYISYIDKMLPDLETLEMIYMHRSSPTQTTDNSWEFKNLQHLQMTCQVPQMVLLMKSVTTIKRLDLNILNGANQETLDYIISCKNLQTLTWFLNKWDELELVFKLSRTPLVTMKQLKLFICFGEIEDIYRRCQTLVNVMEFMVRHKQIEHIIVEFQMTNHTNCLLNALNICETISQYFELEFESSDDEEDIANHSESLFHFLQTFGEVVKHKFNGAWSSTFYLHKIPNKLMPVTDNLFICGSFTKNPDQ